MKKIIRISVYFLLLLGAWLSLAWVSANFLVVEKPVSKADAILILSGSLTFNERAEKAAELYNAGVAKKIFLTNDFQMTGWNKELQRNLYFYEKTKMRLVELGVAENDIEILTEYVGGTIYEAQLFKSFAEKRELKTVLLVTSAYHSRRTIWTFQRVFGADSPTAFGIETPKTGIETASRSLWWLSLSGWNQVCGEYVKFVYYWLRY